MFHPKQGQALALFIGLFVLVAVITIAGGFWWLPPLASEHGAAMDRLFTVTLIVTGVVFVLVHTLLAYFVWRFRGSPERRAEHIREHRGLEIAWTVIPAVILTALIVSGGRLWLQIHRTPPPEAFQVEVWGEQFKWGFRYPGADGRFGRTDPRLISDDNPFGIDLEDPASRDDIFFPAGQGELYLPVGRPVVVYLRAKDVLHSFFVPHLRVKQDAVPGMTTRFLFTATRTGDFEIACAELCGLGHYTMRGLLTIASEEELTRWLAEQPTVADLFF
ncbi:MAG: cytochrome c oxidase subunit II [Bacteroidota bacterium]|nr:cytochrome c oxidase subunit II [Bacteroidota bacterium]MDW8138631.1 cytochrome c oxidase subunit II [Bacteroidota bacterium]